MLSLTRRVYHAGSNFLARYGRGILLNASSYCVEMASYIIACINQPHKYLYFNVYRTVAFSF